ncbi:hypothetical protein PSHT_11629 [Puccinia striiformis]|uniref:Uncharacterized protein n=1 Tax=Puccinia striiformis TaxID=27350 RepID=A0A2S4V233_9BASI|nr:hypothetical protein PSHT_11629 [Puccinia striiformis]
MANNESDGSQDITHRLRGVVELTRRFRPILKASGRPVLMEDVKELWLSTDDMDVLKDPEQFCWDSSGFTWVHFFFAYGSVQQDDCLTDIRS